MYNKFIELLKSGLIDMRGFSVCALQIMLYPLILIGVMSCAEVDRSNPLDTKNEAYDPIKAAEIIADKKNQELLSNGAHSSVISSSTPVSGTSTSSTIGSSVAAAPSSRSSQLSSSIGGGISANSSNAFGNRVPVITQGDIVPVTMDEDGIPRAFSLILTASDADGDILTWSIANATVTGVATASDVGDTVSVLYTPPLNYSGEVTFTVQVQDQYSADTIAIIVSVVTVNDLPEFSSPAIITGSDTVDQTVTISATCIDSSDGDAGTSMEYVWYSDIDTVGYDGTTALGVAAAYIITSAEKGGYIYGIVSCTDAGGAVVYDTSSYSTLIAPERPMETSNAVTLDGVDDYISVPPFVLDVSNGFTVEYWVYWDTTATKNWNALFDFGETWDDDNILMGRFTNTQGVYVQLWKDNVSAQLNSTSNFIDEGHWTHVALTVAPGGLTSIYKNGILDTSKVLSILVENDLLRTSNFIGTNNWDNPGHMGKFDDFRVWETVRSQAEIFDNMHSPNLSGQDGLLWYLNFNSIFGPKAYDVMRNSDATLVKMDTVVSWQVAPQTRQLTVAQQTGGTVAQAGLYTVYESQQMEVSVELDSAYEFGGWTMLYDGDLTTPDSTSTIVSLNRLNDVVTPNYIPFPGKAISLSSSFDHVKIAPLNPNFGNGFSFEAWVKWDGLELWSRVFEMSLGSDFDSEKVYVANDGNTPDLAFHIYNTAQGKQEFKVANYIELGKWIHVAVTISSSGYGIIYKNGVQVGAKAGLELVNTTLRSDVFIGKSNDDGDGFFEGQIDEVRIWNKVLSPSTIVQNMKHSLVGNETGLIVYIDFNEAFGGNTAKLQDKAGGNAVDLQSLTTSSLVPSFEVPYP